MNFIFNERSEHATLTVWKQINPESNERKSKNMIRTIGDLRKAIEEIPDNYNITVNKTLESFQQEVILFKDTLDFSLVDSKSTDIDGTSITFYKLDSTVKDNYKVK